MNNLIKYSLAALLSFGISSSCLAIVITDTTAGTDNGTDVGAIDTFIAEGAQQGSEASETIWVNSILDPTNSQPDLTWTVKTGTVSYYLTDGTVNDATDPSDGVYAFALNTTGVADYFLVKNSTYIALFQNLADISWGVIDTSYLTNPINLPSSGFTISHVTQFDNPIGGRPPAGVPEPGMVALFGMGLLGMGLSHIRRRRKTA